VSATLFAPTIASADSIGGKQAQARRVLAQLDELGHELDRASEAYDGATYRLHEIRASLQVNEYELRIARRNARVAELRLGSRLRDLYMSGWQDSTLEVLLDARSLDDVITSLDDANRVSHADTQIVAEVDRYKHAVTRRHSALSRERRTEERVVVERAAARARIVSGLAEQKRLLSSIRNQIAQLRHEEAVRQAQLAAQAAARLAQQRFAEQQALRTLAVGATAESASGPSGFPSAAVVPPSQVGSRVVGIAEQYLGLPYVWGAAGPYAFDCSGLVTYVFAQVGLSLPHFAAAQWNYGVYVPKDQLEPGDLVFFENLGHVGIYVGAGQYIQAPHPGDVVKITPLSDPWSESNYFGAKRITS
jgi:cell wall-associated NlpC family hydrolase